MTNNDILRRIRYILDFEDSQMKAVFGLGGWDVSREQVCNWLKKDEDPDFLECTDIQTAIFLNGLIIEKRGAKEGGAPEPETGINNNIVFRKLRIALDLKAEDILGFLAKADMRISKHELSAFFRKPDNRHFRVCKDQVLRKFLKGVQMTYRPDVWNQDAS